MKLISIIVVLMMFTISAQGWTKFFDFNDQGDQQQVRCDSDRVSMNSFFEPVIDGINFNTQEIYTTADGIDVHQSVAITRKYYDKKKTSWSTNVYTLRRYQDRIDDKDGSGYMATYTLVLTNFQNNDSFKTSCRVWFKPKGTWSKETMKLMEQADK